MRAAVVERYGAPEVIRITSVPLPSVGAHDVLVRVCAAAVTSADARIRGARFPRGFAPFARLVFGLTRPRRPVLGGCLSGVIESVGTGVKQWAPGAEVVATTGLRMGGHADYAVVPAKRLVAKPSAVSHDEAAGSLFGAITALHFLRSAGALEPDVSVLVNGASGAVGTNAVQLAAHAGAIVTGVCSAANEALVRELGAHEVIDHTTCDVAEVDQRFDVVFDAVGNLSIRTGRALLTDSGRLVLAVAGLGDTVRARGRVLAGPAPERPEDVEHVLALVAAGDLRVVVDGVHDLDAIVEAHRRVDGGHKVGNVLVRP